jgi:hypothetical protein
MAFLFLGIVAVCCWLVGYGLGRRRMKRQIESQKPEREVPRCDCTHLYVSHKAKAPHPCNSSWRAGSSRSCACQRYNGPLPAPTLAELWPEAPKVGE